MDDPTAPVGEWFDSHCHLQERYLAPAAASDGRRSRRRGHDGVDSAAGRSTGPAAAGDGRRGRDAPPRRGVGDRPDDLRRHGPDDVDPGRRPGPGGRAPVRSARTCRRSGRRSACTRTRQRPGRTRRSRWSSGRWPRGPAWSWPSGSAGSTTTTTTHRGRPSVAAFADQIALAQRHDLALVIHARDAWDDLFDVLAVGGRARADGPALLHRRADRGDALPRRSACSSRSAGSSPSRTPRMSARPSARLPARPAARRDRQPVPGAGAAPRPPERAGVRAAGRRGGRRGEGDRPRPTSPGRPRPRPAGHSVWRRHEIAGDCYFPATPLTWCITQFRHRFCP